MSSIMAPPIWHTEIRILRQYLRAWRAAYPKVKMPRPFGLGHHPMDGLIDVPAESTVIVHEPLPKPISARRQKG